jgi:hypothetical protein
MRVASCKVDIFPELSMNEKGWEGFRVRMEVDRGSQKVVFCPFCHTPQGHRMKCQHTTDNSGWRKGTFVATHNETVLIAVQRDYPDKIHHEVHVRRLHFRNVMQVCPVPLTEREAIDLITMKKGAVKEFTFEHDGEQRRGWLFIIHPRDEKHGQKIKDIIKMRHKKWPPQPASV